MKIRSYALAATLGVLGLVLAPGAVRADEVQVTMSITFNGSATCGVLCSETLDGSFLWNTTTQAASDLSETFTGPISYGTFGVSGTSTDLQMTFSDAGGDFATIGTDMGTGSPILGSYTPVGGAPGPGEFSVVDSACVTPLCLADLNNGGVGAASLTVAATPEPGTASLMVIGLLGVLAVPLAYKRLL
jgi:hypothetical protein